MVVVLLSVGGLLAVVGLGCVAYGIPYNEFGIGNTLIETGTTAVSAGLLLIALSFVLRELIAIRAALGAGAGAALGAAAAPAERPAPRSRPVEPPLAPPPEPPSAAVAAERLRAAPSRPSYPTPTGQPPERGDLPPQPPLRAPPTPPPLRRADLEPAGEPPGWRPPVVAPPPGSDIGLPDSLRAPRPAADRRDGPPPLAGPEPAPPEPDWTRDPLGEPLPGGERKRFFAWTRRRQTVSSDAEAPHAETAPPPFERPERGLDRGSDRGPERGSDRGPERGAERAPPPPLAPPPLARPAPEPPAAAEEEPAPVTVLKSGVIDGMGYTLYTDGSIDAAFEHGTLRFDSIEDLRRHLEQSNG